MAITKLADLAITKVSDTNPVAANQVFNYLITVQNPPVLRIRIGFTVTDTLGRRPARRPSSILRDRLDLRAAGCGLMLTCTHGALASGVTTPNALQVQMQVAATPSPAVFTNSAAVSTTENDPVAGNNNVCVQVSTDLTPPRVSA